MHQSEILGVCCVLVAQVRHEIGAIDGNTTGGTDETVTRTGLAGFHFLLKDGEMFVVIQNFVVWWWRRLDACGNHFGMHRLNDQWSQSR